MRRALLLATLTLTLAPAPSRAAGDAGPPPMAAVAAIAAKLAAHRAAYDLSLDHARGEVTSAGGSMAYEVTDACDGWAVRQRLKMTIGNREGQPIQMVSDYATFESKDGSRLSFRMLQTTEQAITQHVEGTASLDRPGGSGTVHYTVPRDVTMKLPAGALFPMWHTAAIIAQAERGAERGGRFFAVPLFDGTGFDGAQDSSVAIAGWSRPGPAPYPQLAELPSGRVHVAFFGRGKNASQPEYEVGMRYWENGVADALAMDFGEFVLAGKLREFSLRPGRC